MTAESNSPMAAICVLATPYPIRPREWTDLLDEYRSAVDSVPALAPAVSFIESVIQNQMQDQLVATTSMWDLVITTAPAGKPRWT